MSNTKHTGGYSYYLQISILSITQHLHRSGHTHKLVTACILSTDTHRLILWVCSLLLPKQKLWRPFLWFSTGKRGEGEDRQMGGGYIWRRITKESFTFWSKIRRSCMKGNTIITKVNQGCNVAMTTHFSVFVKSEDRGILSNNLK